MTRSRSSSGSGRYDASLWTDSGEDRWLGWLDVVDARARSRRRAERLRGGGDRAVRGLRPAGHGRLLARAGGAAADVRRSSRSTSSTRRIRRRSGGSSVAVDLERTLFLVSSKSGSTLETRSHLEYFWERTGGRGAQFAAITDPGSELEQLAHERGFRAVFAGEPEIGGRYSALSMFGIVPAALMGVDFERFLEGAAEMAVACQARGRESGARARPAARGGLAGRAATRSASTSRRPASGSGPSS